jgi:hypothetical protein
MKLKMMIWAVHAARIEEMSKVYKIKLIKLKWGKYFIDLEGMIILKWNFKILFVCGINSSDPENGLVMAPPQRSMNAIRESVRNSAR